MAVTAAMQGRNQDILDRRGSFCQGGILYLCCVFGLGSQERCRCVVPARRFRVSLTAFVPLEQGEHAKRTWESWDGERLRGFVFLTADLGTCPALDRRALVSHRRPGHCSLPGGTGIPARHSAASYQINL